MTDQEIIARIREMLTDPENNDPEYWGYQLVDIGDEVLAFLKRVEALNDRMPERHNSAS